MDRIMEVDVRAAREYTRDEIRDRFLSYIRDMVTYWATESRARTVADRCNGVAFSILAAIDGEAAELPAFVLAPAPHPDDQEYEREHGGNWYPQAPEASCNIAGELHNKLNH